MSGGSGDLARLWQERAPDGPWFVHTPHDGDIFFGGDIASAEQCVSAINRSTQCTPVRDAGEASLPTYGNLPWAQLGRDVTEALIGRRDDFQFGSGYPGHDIAHINFNSLARIVDKYRLSSTPLPRSDCPVATEGPRVVVTDGSVQKGDIITYSLNEHGLGNILSHTRSLDAQLCEICGQRPVLRTAAQSPSAIVRCGDTEASMSAHEADFMDREVELAAAQSPSAPDASVRKACDWPDAPFTFYDEPGEHDPCYVVMPGGAMLSLNHHAGIGVDIARAKFIIAACNSALAGDAARWFKVAKTEADGRERMSQLAADRLAIPQTQSPSAPQADVRESERSAWKMLMAQLIVRDAEHPGNVAIPEQTLPASVYDKALAAALALPPVHEAGREATIEECALIAEGFDAAYDSPRMKLFVDAGLVVAVYKRDGEIGAAIRSRKKAILALRPNANSPVSAPTPSQEGG